ncbi:MAG: F0F1 ATP synthase subunit B [Patescibacteria group bacterium]
MDELVKTFHIDVKLLIAQLINFGIVLGVLWYFALRPLMRMMHQRTHEIDKSLKDAKQIEQKLREAEHSKESIITEAKKESAVIVEQAFGEAEKVREQKLHETREEMERLSAKAKADLAQEKDKMVASAKQEVAELVIAATGKILEKNIDPQINRHLIEETIHHAKK